MRYREHYGSYHKGVELRGASSEFWSALSDAQLDRAGSAFNGSWIHLAHDPTKHTRQKKVLLKQKHSELFVNDDWRKMSLSQKQLKAQKMSTCLNA